MVTPFQVEEYDIEQVRQNAVDNVRALQPDDEKEEDTGDAVLGSSPGVTRFGPGITMQDLLRGEDPFRGLYRERDVETMLDRMSPWDLADLQAQLAEGGLLNSYKESWLDDETIEAFGTVLTLSNRSGQPWQAVVTSLQNQALQAEMARQRRATTPQPRLTTTVTDPETLRNMFRDEVIAMTGEDRGTVDTDRMVEAYQNLERRYQQQSWNANLRGGGGEIVAPPSAQEFARQQIAEAAPVETQTRDVVDRAGQLFDMLGGPFAGGS